MKNASSIGIIGGADGPTAVLIAGEILPAILIGAAVVLTCALIITAVVVSHRRK